MAAVVAIGVAAGGLATGDAVGSCANTLIASAVEQMQRRINFFIEVICSWDALNARFGFNNFKAAEAIKRLRPAGRWTLLFPSPDIVAHASRLWFRKRNRDGLRYSTAGVAQW